MQVRSAAAVPLSSSPSLTSVGSLGMQEIIKSSCDQFRKEHDATNKGRYFPQFMSLILGHKTTRQISNFFGCIGFPDFYVAQRNYSILPPTQERLELAKKYAPILSSMSESQAQCAQTNRSELRYELLPPSSEHSCYTLIYYLGFPTERVPVSVLDRLYEWLRPILYGSKKDWEAVRIDLEPVSMEPVSVSFETSNYTSDPESYNTLRSEDLHLKCQVKKEEDGSWKKILTQQNGQSIESEVKNPFSSGSLHPCLTFVSWNGSLELSSEIANKPGLKTYRISSSEVQFLDIETFRAEGMDLRVGWIQERKFGRFIMTLPPRKTSNA